MSTDPRETDPPDEVPTEEIPIEEPTGLLTPEGLRAEAFRTVDGAYGDDPVDPAMIPVIEAAEALLVDHATEGAPDGTRRILRDAFAPEAGAEHGVYGEADQEASSERTDR